QEVAQFLGVPESKTLKAVFYAADGQVVFVTIRGDLEVNEVKLKNALKVADLRLATADEVARAGITAGFASPVGLNSVKRVADDSIHLGSNFVVGANRPDYHLRNANHPRDFDVDIITDIALAQEGQLCVKCGTPLQSKRGIEVGHVFKLGLRYSQIFNASFLDKDGALKPILMGCYGIGVGRLLAASIESNHDDKGMIFPASIAPYHVNLCSLGDDPEIVQAAEKLAAELSQSGLEVLYDDRPETAGVKFNDADLLGLPVRAVISKRSLKNGGVELKKRSEKDPRTVAIGEAVATVKEMVGLGS
ncbi:MAG: proline--tRNA ligase, partial [Chloroflexi bacterium]|nr:proline--tRNA ligase [Chloroflexota bacterium]